jgi:hypothetical protein
MSEHRERRLPAASTSGATSRTRRKAFPTRRPREVEGKQDAEDHDHAELSRDLRAVDDTQDDVPAARDRLLDQFELTPKRGARRVRSGSRSRLDVGGLGHERDDRDREDREDDEEPTADGDRRGDRPRSASPDQPQDQWIEGRREDQREDDRDELRAASPRRSR